MSTQTPDDLRWPFRRLPLWLAVALAWCSALPIACAVLTWRAWQVAFSEVRQHIKEMRQIREGGSDA